MLMPTIGLYAITPDGKQVDEILTFSRAVLEGGAKILQYRDKSTNNKEIIATQLRQLCHVYDVPLIINDDIELAEKIGADGVHLGQDDGCIRNARQRLGEKAIIGISCYNSLEQAFNAQKEGATYVAFGRFFSSTSKPLATPAQIGTLSAAKKFLSVPIVAIGGVLPENGAELLNAGADLLAVIGGLATDNPKQAAYNYNALFFKHHA
jgi:thiamine-phosphate pyrophosphorylase